jgi:hypothetical protein
LWEGRNLLPSLTLLKHTILACLIYCFFSLHFSDSLIFLKWAVIENPYIFIRDAPSN